MCDWLGPCPLKADHMIREGHMGESHDQTERVTLVVIALGHMRLVTVDGRAMATDLKQTPL